jgi:hypothetical protein
MLSGAHMSMSDFIRNIVPVTLGNTLGGVMVATAYYLVFLSNRAAHRSAAMKPNGMWLTTRALAVLRRAMRWS